MTILGIDSKNIELTILDEDEKVVVTDEICVLLKIKKRFFKELILNSLFLDKKNNKEAIFLTKREKQILEYISSGINNAQIANKLNVSIHTTKVHIHNIFDKLSAKDRTEAVVKAIKYGLIPFPENFQSSNDNEQKHFIKKY